MDVVLHFKFIYKEKTFIVVGNNLSNIYYHFRTHSNDSGVIFS